jgi:hypothetical protein
MTTITDGLIGTDDYFNSRTLLKGIPLQEMSIKTWLTGQALMGLCNGIRGHSPRLCHETAKMAIDIADEVAHLLEQGYHKEKQESAHDTA